MRRNEHPLDIIEEKYPKLVNFFKDKTEMESILLPPGGLKGDSCIQLIMKYVEKIEKKAEKASREGDHKLYHSLTYVSDSFIPLLLLAQSSKKNIMPVKHIQDSWPSVDKNVMHEGRLPALMHLVFQCCFWSDNSKKSIPIVHFMTKGVPKRCQVRSLIDIIDKKQQEDRSLMNFILDIFNCFALGGYEHNKTRPVFEMRKRLYSNLIFDRKAKNNVRNLYTHCKIITEVKKGKQKQKKVYENANIMTLAVREYLCTCVRLIPSLHEVLVDRCDWNSFEEDVFSNSDRARQLMNDNFASGHYWFANMDAVISAKKTNKDSNIYQPIKNAFVSTFNSSMISFETDYLCSKEYASRQHAASQSTTTTTFLHDKLDKGVTALLSTALNLYDDTQLTITEEVPQTKEECIQFIEENRIPLVCFGCSVESALAVKQVHEKYNEEERAKFIHLLTEQLWKKPIDFALNSFIFRELDLKNSVRLQPLPLHYIQYQYIAILHRYGLPETTSLEAVVRKYGKISVCTQCKTVRSFVVTPETNKKSFSFYAHGNDRVVVDHVTMKIFCTGKKRDDKVAATSSYKNIATIAGDNFNPMDMEKAFKKDRKRKLKKEGERRQSQLCRQTEIKTISIVGQMFDFFGKSYVLCCYCARITEFDGRRYYDDAFVCGCCTQESETLPVTCSMCVKKERKRGTFATYKDIISDVGGGQGERISIHLCPSHNKPWIAAEYENHSHMPLSMSRIIQGFDESWRSVVTASGSSVTIAQTQRKYN